MTIETKDVWFYFQAVLWCHECEKQYAVMMRARSSDYFEATQRLSGCRCIRCNLTDTSELQNLHELQLQYLEDYMRWA